MVKSNEINIFQGELMWQYNWPPQGIDMTQKFFFKILWNGENGFKHEATWWWFKQIIVIIIAFCIPVSILVTIINYFYNLVLSKQIANS